MSSIHDDDHFHDQCGLFGVFGSREAANLTYLGLHCLQHRGQESAGIATANQGRMLLHRDLGLVRDIFDQEILNRLPGSSAIGHVRYSTAGESTVRDAQPLAMDYAYGSMAVAHNGNLTNYLALRRKLEAEGSIFQSGSDSEVLVHLIARSREKSTVDRVADDYPMLVAPGQPGLRVNVTVDEIARYSPKRADVIDLETNTFETVDVRDLLRAHGNQIPLIRRVVSVLEKPRVIRSITSRPFT